MYITSLSQEYIRIQSVPQSAVWAYRECTSMAVINDFLAALAMNLLKAPLLKKWKLCEQCINIFYLLRNKRLIIISHQRCSLMGTWDMGIVRT